MPLFRENPGPNRWVWDSWGWQPRNDWVPAAGRTGLYSISGEGVEGDPILDINSFGGFFPSAAAAIAAYGPRPAAGSPGLGPAPPPPAVVTPTVPTKSVADLVWEDLQRFAAAAATPNNQIGMPDAQGFSQPETPELRDALYQLWLKTQRAKAKKRSTSGTLTIKAV